MAKAIAMWSGIESGGRSVEVARREDGKLFGRVYEWNGYGKAWSRWLPVSCKEKVDGNLEWGFNTLSRYKTDAPRVRLPG